ncbi:hypothetical protein TNCV_3529541 [Trichonephila clavipes]|uniref:Uncharacterized protein n=1 Tax=Trichonephila clavipes TaxID=2585209 RepID=A0A8X6RJR3_TRICX|nr:hypothetical protein TNCV_3529541 [Trichonephila clavipes]
MSQDEDDECMLPMCVHHDPAKHGFDHLDAVKRTWIHQIKSRLTIREHRFVVNHTIEDAPVHGAASRVSAAMVSELRVYAVANVTELFVQTLVVLQTTPIIHSGS